MRPRAPCSAWRRCSATSASPGRLIAPVTQAELADAVGTSREVVVRILRDLREAELVETGRDGIVLAVPERLIEEGQYGTP